MKHLKLLITAGLLIVLLSACAGSQKLILPATFYISHQSKIELNPDSTYVFTEVRGLIANRDTGTWSRLSDGYFEFRSHPDTIQLPTVEILSEHVRADSQISFRLINADATKTRKITYFLPEETIWNQIKIQWVKVVF